jgi:hypothetical protein
MKKVPIRVVSIIFPDSTILTTALPVGVATTWDSLAGKPLTFPPAAHTHDYTTLTNLPGSIQLQAAVLQVVLFEVLTQTQINALSPAKGKVVINSTSNCLQWYDGAKWRIFAMTN